MKTRDLGSICQKPDSSGADSSLSSSSPNAPGSFGTILSKFAQETTPGALMEQGLKTASEDTLRDRRKGLLSDLSQAMRSGDLDTLHKLQSEYDSLTKELRARCTEVHVASVAQTPPVAAAPPPNPTPVSPIATNLPEAGVTHVRPAVESVHQNIFGVPEEVWEKVSKDETIRPALLSMPKEAVALYQQTTPEEKKELAKHATGTTHVFFFTIDNRQAFVTGEVMGRSAFQYLQDAIDKQMNDGKISMDEGMRRKSAINILKSLSPLQREGFLRLIEQETGIAKG